MKLQAIITNVQTGVLSAVLEVLGVVSFAALIFSGPLAAHLTIGIVLLLISTTIIGLVGTLGSSYPGMLVSLRTPMIPVLAAMVAAIAATMTAEGREADLLGTTIATLGVTSIVTGLALGLLGRFSLGRLVRYFPYPVMAGFFAGTGAYLVTGGLSVAADQPVGWEHLPAWFSPGTLPQWGSALGFGAAFYVVQRRWDHWLVAPLFLLLGVAAFHVLVWSSGLTLEETTASGWLPRLSASQASLLSFDFGHLSSAHWPTVAAQAGSIAAIAVLCAVLLLLDVAAIEIAVNREIEPNRELKVAGAANVACGLVGGCPGVQSLTDTAFVSSLGGDRRLMGFVRVLCFVLAGVAGVGLVAMFPLFLLGGFLVYVGIDFLWRWGWEIRRELPPTDYLVVLLILLVCVWKGILLGILFGVVMSVALFAITYSRLSSIKSELTGRDRAGHIERAPETREILDREGDRILILRLQGVIFFGTAGDLMSVIRDRLAPADGPGPEYLVLDLQHVDLIDASGARSFSRLAQITESHGVSVVVTGHRGKMRRQLEGIGFFTEPAAAAPVHRLQFSQLNEGVAWCEDRLLDRRGISEPGAADTLEGRLARLLGDEDAARSVAPFFERQEHAAGGWLFRHGEPGDSLYLVDSGTLSVVIDTAEGEAHVVRVYTSGAVLGEMAVYMEGSRTASLRIEAPSVLFRLDADGLRRLQLRHPEAAGRFHATIVRMIAGRLECTTRELRRHL